MNETDYDYWFPDHRLTGDAYSFCCWQILAGIRTWIIRNKFHGEIAYFFEAGHKSQPQANAIMNRIFNHPNLRANYCYGCHAFVDKQKVRPVQTADILAWHQALQVKRWLNNDGRMRKDFQALLTKPRHEIFLATRKTMGGVIAYYRSLYGLPMPAGLTGRFGHHWFWCSFDGGDGLLV